MKRFYAVPAIIYVPESTVVGGVTEEGKRRLADEAVLRASSHLPAGSVMLLDENFETTLHPQREGFELPAQTVMACTAAPKPRKTNKI